MKNAEHSGLLLKKNEDILISITCTGPSSLIPNADSESWGTGHHLFLSNSDDCQRPKQLEWGAKENKQEKCTLKLNGVAVKKER